MSNKEEIFQKKTIDAAVNTIMTKMEELNGASDSDKEIMKRRWIWELIQNANDCANSEKINIWIKNNENELVFSHNGEIFTYNNIIDLVTQISSKRSNEEKIGKFGTGFISTHLISNIIKIKGFYHEDETSRNYKYMDIDIDRSGKTESKIKESIVNVINKIDKIENGDNVEFLNNRDKITTSFIYNLYDKDIKEIIKVGFKDLDNCIAFVLVFAKTINEIHCNDFTYRITSDSCKLTEGLELIKIEKRNNKTHESKLNKVLLCTDKNNEVSIATLVKEKEGQYYINSLENIPKIFCEFPLIGTEDFSFPVVLNSRKLKVLQERNYIQEGSEENKKIIDIAISLYKNMIEYLSNNKWGNLYNICYMKSTSKSVLQLNIKNSIEGIYNVVPIVEVNDKSGSCNREKLFTELDGKLVANIVIPYSEKEELGDDLWFLFNSLNIKYNIPSKESYRYWAKISPKLKVALQDIQKYLLNGKTMSQLKSNLIDSSKIIEWLNIFYDLWIKSTNEINLKITALIPNQKGEFVEIAKLSIDKNIDKDLKEILILLGNDINEELIHKDIKLLEKLNIKSYDNEFISDKICSIIRRQLSSENSNTTKRSHEIQSTFNKLTDWFFKNPKLGKQLFKDIYDMQHLLSSPKETIRRLELANTIETTMNENNIEVDQLEIILNESGKLIKMFENGEIKLSEDAKQLFNHISSKSIYAKERLDTLIDRSINSVYLKLSQNPLYSVEDTLEGWKESRYSRTVFKAKKENRDIRIVIRPSDNNKIIFYEDTELEALDDTDYELWTNDENGVTRIITLGDLIKTTGITVIPLAKII
ncbi:sacsin N-terminal ATP-binding-like domain-containing protein [Clostridium tertium]